MIYCFRMPSIVRTSKKKRTVILTYRAYFDKKFSDFNCAHYVLLVVQMRHRNAKSPGHYCFGQDSAVTCISQKTALVFLQGLQSDHRQQRGRGGGPFPNFICLTQPDVLLNFRPLAHLIRITSHGFQEFWRIRQQPPRRQRQGIVA